MIGTAAFLLIPQYALVFLAFVIGYSIWQVTQYVAKRAQDSEHSANSVQARNVHLD